MPHGDFPVTQPSTICTTDLDEARSVVGSHFYAHFLDVLDWPAQLAATFSVIGLGPLTLGDLRYGTDVSLRIGELGAYHVDVPLSGRVASRQGGRAFLASTRCASVFQPVGDTVVDRLSGDCRVLALKIECGALERQLELLLDAPVRAPIGFATDLDLSRAAALSWTRLLTVLADEIPHQGGLLYQPMVAGRLCEAVLNGLLLLGDHPYRGALERPGRRCAPRTVKRVVDAICASPEQPFTVAALADIAGISPRSLQDAFQRHVGLSPMAYLREVRLDRVHEDLRRSEPGQLTVADAAYRWGFAHLGRFAAAYRARYGTSPSETLRG